MGKYHGAIGYGVTEETRPGVWTNNITEKTVFGEVIKNAKRTDGSGKVNDDLMVNIQISFLMDPYARQNFHSIKYATYMGSRWKVTIVENNYPRLTLTLGAVYNEQ